MTAGLQLHRAADLDCDHAGPGIGFDVSGFGEGGGSLIALRKAMARFWARGNADESIERSMRPQIESRPLEDLE